MDSIARNQAEQVARGNAGEDYGSKAVFYGHLARLIDDSLQEPLKLRTTPRSFRALKADTREMLYGRLRASYRKSADRRTIDQVAQRHMIDTFSYHEPMYPPTLSRLHDGLATFSIIELQTLQTIAYRLQRSESVSEKGVFASQRIPFAFAIAHLADLRFLNEVVEPATLNGETRDVYSDEAVTLDPKHGLVFNHKPPFGTIDILDIDNPYAQSPHVGCPVTLVAGAMTKLHATIAGAALEAGLIVPT